jgi:glycosyltransferase involved in cell wall biosynthesis
MARALAPFGVRSDVSTTDDDGPGLRLKNVPLGTPLDRQDFRVFYFPKQTEFYKTSLPLATWLRRNVRAYEAVHIHALFSFSSLASGMISRQLRVPYIIRPLGVLNEWGMKNRRRWLKNLSFRLLEAPLLRGAAAIHFTSEQELAEADMLGPWPQAAIIPLGLDLTPFDHMPAATEFPARRPRAAGKTIVLFLSRLDPKKGVERLIEAFALCAGSHPDALLVIAGAGDAAYVDSLRSQASRAGIADRVEWAGHLEGAEKLAALASASVFVLPSSSENFGIALLEAMAARLPCISTQGVALAADASRHGAVLAGDGSPAWLAEKISLLLRDDGARAALAQKAAAVCREHYSLDAMGSALAALYRRIASR